MKSVISQANESFVTLGGTVLLPSRYLCMVWVPLANTVLSPEICLQYPAWFIPFVSTGMYARTKNQHTDTATSALINKQCSHGLF